jgi:Ca-activated chloride channel family protein
VTLRFEEAESRTYAGPGDTLPALSDEDCFILTKLGIAEPNWKAETVTSDLRRRYRDEYVNDWCRRVIQDCRPRPNEVPRDMFFRFWGDNPFEFAAVDALSTFSADVDTASYTLARRYVNEGHLPTKEQVRTEEFVNYFKADVPAPESGTFAIHTTVAPSRFGTPGPGEMVARERDMLRVVVRAKDVPKAQRKPLALTFVVDCSGSMKEQDRIGMVKHAIRLLVSQLDARDSISIVKFSTDAALVLPMTSAREKGLIESAIDPLVADGSTNSEAGLRMGYNAALAG